MHTGPFALARLLINRRRLWIPCIIVVGLCAMSIMMHQPDMPELARETSIPDESHASFPFSISHSLTYEQVQDVLNDLFDPMLSLEQIQLLWNQLIDVWRQILTKLLRDACELCHRNQPYCHDSIDIARYVYHINESFYPSDESKRPTGMGLYYYFDLKSLRSVNNSILPTDVSPCDYFHMIQLMINVQLILHQAQVKYFLTKGTLIGVLRHHDVIPWDTDIDLFIPASATPKILQSFRQLDLSTHLASTTTEASTARLAKE